MRTCILGKSLRIGSCYLHLNSCYLLKYFALFIMFHYFFSNFFYEKLGRDFDIDLISVDKLIETSTKRGAGVIVWKIVKRLL